MSSPFGKQILLKGVEHLSSDVTLEAAENLSLRQPFGLSSCCIGSRAIAVAKPDDGDHVQGAVGAAIAARVQAVTARLSRGGGDRTGRAEVGEGGLAAKAVDVLAGADEELCCMMGADPDELESSRRDLAHKAFERAIERGDLDVERRDAAGDASQGELGCMQRLVGASGIHAEASAEASLTDKRLRLERFTELGGRGDDEVTELAEGRGAGLYGPVAGDVKLADGLDRAARVLGNDHHVAREDLAGGSLGVYRIALALAMPDVVVRLIHLENANAMQDERPGQTGAVRAGRFNTHRDDPTKRLQPSTQCVVAVLIGGERRLTELLSALIERHCVVHAEVTVDSANHPLATICHLAPLCSSDEPRRADKTAMGLCGAGSYQVTSARLGH